MNQNKQIVYELQKIDNIIEKKEEDYKNVNEYSNDDKNIELLENQNEIKIKKIEILLKERNELLKELFLITKKLEINNKKINKYELIGKKKKNIKHSTSINISGFAKPSKVPEQICELLGINKNEFLPRPKVTSKIFDYVNKNNLIVGGNNEKGLSKTFKLDDKLKKAFDIELNYNYEISFKQFQKILANVYNKKNI